MKPYVSRTFSIISLIAVIAIIIAVVAYADQIQLAAPAIAVVSIVLGWLLKTVGDALTENKRRQWELEDEFRQRTLKYYETKLDDLSQLVVTEVRRLNTQHKHIDNKSMRFVQTELGLSRDDIWILFSTKTFVTIVADPELTRDYEGFVKQRQKLYDLVKQINNGVYDTSDSTTIDAQVTSETEALMLRLKTLQFSIEKARVQVLKGELALERKKL